MRNRNTQRILSFLVSVLLFFNCNSANKADYAFINGGVYTICCEENLWAEAVAIKGDQIIAVGSNEEIQKTISEKTQVMDLTGKMLMPGFIDAHIHPLFGSLFVQGAEIQSDDKIEILQTVKQYAQSHPQSKIIRGYGWRYGAFPESGPVKEDLDVIIIDRPVVLISVDAHTAWLNSKALSMAGVTAETHDPVPGYSYFARDEKTGELTGWVIELTAILKVLNALEPIDAKTVENNLRVWASQFSQAGITTVFDAGILGHDQREGYAIYNKMSLERKLPFRVVGAYAVTTEDTCAVKTLKKLHDEFHSDWVNVNHVKLFLDGTDATYTAAMLEPYADKPDTKGDLSFSESYIKEIVKQADKQNFDVMFHALGDRAARIALDAVDDAIKENGERERRHTLAHLQACHPADWSRFAKQNSIAQFSIQWAVPDPYLAITLSRWGKERSAHLYPARAIMHSGGKITFGSDWPAAAYYITFKPLEALQVAVTRKQINHPDETPLMPLSERFTLQEALQCYTINGAYQLRMENKIGSIEVGKYADLIVLDKNLFVIPDSTIHKVAVILTMTNGKIVHSLR